MLAVDSTIGKSRGHYQESTRDLLIEAILPHVEYDLKSSTNLQVSFSESRSYKWIKQRALRFGWRKNIHSVFFDV